MADLARLDAWRTSRRRYAPYKAWLVERRIFIAAISDNNAATVPSADEIAACDVAQDLAELDRHDEAKALLSAQAPNRLARKCMECGAAPGAECVGLFTSSTGTRHLVNELIPHHARLVGHLDAGPLCTSRNEVPRG